MPAAGAAPREIKTEGGVPLLGDVLSARQIRVVTLAILLSLFLAAVEATVVSTAMPTIISQLGGLHIYSWVFTVYFLASTTMTPVFGRLSDLYGRRPVFLAGMALFLLGSALSGLAGSMGQLIVFRTLQGVGGGALLPMAFILIGDLYSLEDRARMQGLFAAVWAVAGLAGPLLGGFLADHVSWRWVFFVNLPFGGLAIWLVWTHLREPRGEQGERYLDLRGAFYLVAATSALLFLLTQATGAQLVASPLGWALVATVLAGYALFAREETRAPDPLVPLELFRRRIIAVAAAHGFLAGWAMFGTTAFAPLFMQGVLGTTATQAGATLTPMIIGWTAASTLGGRLLLRTGLRLLATAGSLLLLLGTVLLTRWGEGTSLLAAMSAMALMGLGMGLAIPAFLVAVQNVVVREELGIATSLVQFSRMIGGTIGTATMGGMLAASLRGRLDGTVLADVDVRSLLQEGGGLSGGLQDALRGALAGALHEAFLLPLAVSVLALLVVRLTPAGLVSAHREEAAAARAAVPAEDGQ